jgi:hypothetical protein
MAPSYSNPYGSQDQYSPGGYGGYWPQQFTGATNQRTSPGHELAWAVLLLGLATYVISYAAALPPGDLSWGVRFSASAAVVAALGLLPRQNAHSKVVTALAMMGFLEALSRWITSDHNPGWATIAIVALNALQVIAAIAALARLKVDNTAEHGSAGYDAYAYYAQAAQQYYAASNQQLQPQQRAQAQETAHAKAAAPAQEQQSTAEHYALYTEYLDAQHAQPNPSASPSGGRTQAAGPAAGTRMPASGPTESSRLRGESGPGTAGQSPQL